MFGPSPIPICINGGPRGLSQSSLIPWFSWGPLLPLLSSDSESRSLVSGLSPSSPLILLDWGRKEGSIGRRCVKNWALFPNEWRERAPYCHDIPACLVVWAGLYTLLSSLHQCFIIIIEYLSLLAATQLQASKRARRRKRIEEAE